MFYSYSTTINELHLMNGHLLSFVKSLLDSCSIISSAQPLNRLLFFICTE